MNHLLLFFTASGSILLGWILHGIFRGRALEDAIVLVHKLDEENRRLTLTVLDLHKMRRQENQGKVP